MITAADLRTQTVKELGELAKQMGVSGWHSMRKDQLVTA
ncbi:MAG: Rho termination factor N-terminal domain-containing protein, partial [Pirellulaceae bacterium]